MTDMFLFEAASGAYTNYLEKEKKEQLNVNSFPQLKPYFYDEFGNMFSLLPPEGKDGLSLIIKKYVEGG